MTRGAQRLRLRGITKFLSSRKQQITPPATPGFGARSGRLWSRRIRMWWRLMAGIISDRSLPRIAVWAAGYPWSSCLRALAKMNLVPGGRKPSNGESSVCTLPHSSAGSVTSSISLNLECRANGSLPDTMWSITIILGGAPRKFELRNRRGLPENYFLASARFIEKKNLSALIEAYAQYRQRSKIAPKVPWDLVVLGDGPLRETLNSELSTLNLNEHVHMTGFKPYDELPVYYELANALVHASTTEQWGLVVNEAIASGLPVIVSDRCGCVPELINGNGFTFDPTNEHELTARLLEMASLSDEERKRFGENSYRIAANFAPERFGEGLERAASVAMGVPQKRFGVMDRALLLVTANY